MYNMNFLAPGRGVVTTVKRYKGEFLLMYKGEELSEEEGESREEKDGGSGYRFFFRCKSKTVW